VTRFDDIDMHAEGDSPRPLGSKVQIDSYESDKSGKKERSKYIDDLDSADNLQEKH